MAIENVRRLIIFLPQEVHTGGERYLVEVFNYLHSQGIRVEPIYLERSTEAKHGLALVLDCLIANLRFFRCVRQLGDLSNVIFFEDFHLHPRLWLFNLLVRLVSGRLRTVVLMQSALFHHSILRHRWARWMDEWAVRVFLRWASLILTNSEFTQREVLSLGIDPEKVKVIYCGYEDILAAKPTEARAIRQKKDPKRILFVGQCAEVKGIEFLLRAIPMFADQQATLDMVGNTAGEPKYFTRLRHIIKVLGLKDRVVFHGHISEKKVLSQFYKRADVFVLPSLVEGFGIVLLDAMSFGLPIVATRVGAIPELVKDDINGLLIQPADSPALSKAIGRLLNSPTLRKKYGKAGLDFVTNHSQFYSWEAVGVRMLKAIKPLLEEKPL